MVDYPALTQHQQRKLPALLKPAEAVAAQFADSSHQLWFCETEAGALVLKVADKNTIRQSAFWQGVNRLFALNFPASLADTADVQAFLSARSPLQIPHCLHASSSFVLCQRLTGHTLQRSDLTPEMIQQLAEHIAGLHLQQSENWGALIKPKFSPAQWASRLRQTLAYLAAHNEMEVPSVLLGNALKQAADIVPDRLVPVMLDLRWDQFLTQDKKLSALVDLDAFVWAPLELDLVLLECLLDKTQAQVFLQSYQQTQPLPDLTRVRTAYRVLLFLMHMLGEKDCRKWLAKPAHFQS